jgi:hypothetical protein
MVSCGRDLQLAGLDELLVAPIQQAGDLPVKQPTRAGEDLHRTVRRSRNLRRTAVFPYLNSIWGALCTVGRGSNIESLAAEQGKNVIESAGWGLFCHKCHTLDLLTVAYSLMSINRSGRRRYPGETKAE